MPNADSLPEHPGSLHCSQLKRVFLQKEQRKHSASRGHLHIHTQSYFPGPRNRLSPVPCESLWTSFLYLDMGWREVWNQHNVELCPPFQKTSHCTGQEENSRYLQSVFCTRTQKSTCCISLGYDLTQLRAGTELIQHIYIKRYSLKSLRLFSKISRGNSSLCSYAHRALLLSPFWRGDCLITISSTGKKSL